jgi:ribosomal protein S18 acetylase RimI-like enzyme
VSGELATAQGRATAPGFEPAPGLELVARIEAHSVRAWPAETIERTHDGWVLRASPGLPGRGRSNHALTPPRRLAPDEYEGALARVAEFARHHRIACGVQASPLDVQEPLLDKLAAHGWQIHQPVVVMTADTEPVAADADPDLRLQVTDTATPAWVAAWARCDQRSDVEDHVQSVFPRMAGTARFARCGQRATGISVELDGIVGLFCMAVAPDARRQGLGKALVRAMLARHEAPLAYLQVFNDNAAGLALYDSLGFHEEYRYRHCVAPNSAGGGVSVPAHAVIPSRV